MINAFPPAGMAARCTNFIVHDLLKMAFLVQYLGKTNARVRRELKKIIIIEQTHATRDRKGG